MSTTHELKTWPPYFEAVVSGRKTFEVRENDRDFQEGDTVRLTEWDPGTRAYTGREHIRRITYVLAGFDAVRPTHVVLGLDQDAAEARGFERAIALCRAMEADANCHDFGPREVRYRLENMQDERVEESDDDEPKGCNRHKDCAGVEAEAKAAGKAERYGPGSSRVEHCHDSDCEDCLGR